MKPVRTQFALLVLMLASTACSSTLATASPEQFQTQVAQALVETEAAFTSTPLLTPYIADTPTSLFTPTITDPPTSSFTPLLTNTPLPSDTPITTLTNTPPPCIVPPSAGTCSRILFIGNSYTYTNDLPTTFADLAGSGGHPVETGMAAPGGATLSDHVQSSDALDKLKSSKWDIVVLQEQSEIPASQQSRTQSMYPAARVLVHQIKEVGATPLFFLTWAHRDGWPENGLPDYGSMQNQINQGYLGIAQELNVGIAPVGYAWSIAIGQDPKLNLWQEDGSHPTKQGTYLAACVFYATIFRQSPEGLTFLGQLPQDVAQVLQTIAANTVLNDHKQWNLP